MLLLTLRGTPTMYYGDELGLARTAVSPEFTQDLWEKNEPGLGREPRPLANAIPLGYLHHAGFTTGRPWLPLDPTYRTKNVKSLRQQYDLLLMLYHRLIQIRKAHRALTIGDAASSVRKITSCLTREPTGTKVCCSLKLQRRGPDTEPGPNHAILTLSCPPTWTVKSQCQN